MKIFYSEKGDKKRSQKILKKMLEMGCLWIIVCEPTLLIVVSLSGGHGSFPIETKLCNGWLLDFTISSKKIHLEIIQLSFL